MDVQMAGVTEDAMIVKQQSAGRGEEQDLSSGYTGEQISNGVSLGREEFNKEVLWEGEEPSREVPLSSRGRDLSRHLLWSQQWLDFTSRLEKKHQNLDKLEMEKGQFTDTTALESDSMGSDLCCDAVDEDTTLSDSEDSSFKSYMDIQEEESESDCSADLSIMIEDREDQEEDGYVFDSMVEDLCVQCEEHADSGALICCHNCRREALPVCHSDDPIEWLVVLGRVAVNGLYFRHRWKTFLKKNLRKGTSHVTLCKHCEWVLSKRDPSAGSS